MTTPSNAEIRRRFNAEYGGFIRQSALEGEVGTQILLARILEGMDGKPAVEHAPWLAKYLPVDTPATEKEMPK